MGSRLGGRRGFRGGRRREVRVEKRPEGRGFRGRLQPGCPTRQLAGYGVGWQDRAAVGRIWRGLPAGWAKRARAAASNAVNSPQLYLRGVGCPQDLPYAGTYNPGTRIFLVKIRREKILHTEQVPKHLCSNFRAYI